MSGFQKFMVVNDIGTGRKLRRLPVVQRWTYVAGVLAIASQSPIRGALLIHDGEHATIRDIAEQATVKDAEAKATLESLRRLGMLETDAHGVDWVHDWDEINPTPKPSDSPEARRQRKREQREREQAERHGHVTRDVTPLSRDGHAVPSREHARSPEGKEEEVEELLPPDPPLRGGNGIPSLPVGEAAPTKPRGNRQRHAADHDAAMTVWANTHFPAAASGAVSAAVSWLTRSTTTGPVTASDVRDLALTSDTWAYQLGLSATTEGASAA